MNKELRFGIGTDQLKKEFSQHSRYKQWTEKATCEKRGKAGHKTENYWYDRGRHNQGQCRHVTPASNKIMLVPTVSYLQRKD